MAELKFINKIGSENCRQSPQDKKNKKKSCLNVDLCRLVFRLSCKIKKKIKLDATKGAINNFTVSNVPFHGFLNNKNAFALKDFPPEMTEMKNKHSKRSANPLLRRGREDRKCIL
jgi:hypothetical protein